MSYLIISVTEEQNKLSSLITIEKTGEREEETSRGDKQDEQSLSQDR